MLGLSKEPQALRKTVKSNKIFFQKNQPIANEYGTNEPSENGPTQLKKDVPNVLLSAGADDGGHSALGQLSNPTNLSERDGKQGQNPSLATGKTDHWQSADAPVGGNQNHSSFSPLGGLKDFSMLLNQDSLNSNALKEKQANVNLTNSAFQGHFGLFHRPAI